MNTSPPAIPLLENVRDVFTFILVISCLFAFCLYWFVSQSAYIERIFKRLNPQNGHAIFVLFGKYFGALVMGVLPLLVLMVSHPLFELNWLLFGKNSKWDWENTLIWTVGIGIPVAVIAYFSARKPPTLEQYPEIRNADWDNKLIAKYLLAWFFYLLGYELMFRGVLFITLPHSTGFWIALSVNVLMYTATHIPKGLNETIGAFFLGILLCIATWKTQSIGCAFFVHIIMSWTGNYSAIQKIKSTANLK
jgi:membrane protease YdiL (CAAX protease family)